MVSIVHETFAIVRKNVFVILLVFVNFLVLYVIILLQLKEMIILK